MLVNLFNCFFPKFPSSQNGVWYTSSIDPLSTFGRTSSISLPSCEVIFLVCCWAIICTCDYVGSYFHCLINNVSPGVGEVVVIKKSVCLSFCPSTSCFPFSFLPWYCTVHDEILNVQVLYKETNNFSIFNFDSIFKRFV